MQGSVLPEATTPRIWPLLRVASVCVGTLLLFLLAFMWSVGAGPFRVPTPHEQLVAAVGMSRPVLARFTGGFSHGIRREPNRSTTARTQLEYAVLAAAARAKADALRQTTPDRLHVLGVAEVITGDIDAAIPHLEQGVAEAPGDVRFQNDLAAAYLARAEEFDRAADYPLALAAAERALAIDADHPEATFNRALALEGLALTGSTGRAWSRFLELDSRSPWAAEARARAARESEQRGVSWDEIKSEFADSLGKGDASRIAKHVEQFPDRVRDFFDDELLPAWGAARLRSDRAHTARLLNECATVASELLRVTGDNMPRDACTRVRVVSLSDDIAAQSLASGLVRFGKGRALYDQDRVAESTEEFRAARRALQRVGANHSMWCAVYESIAAYYGGTFGAVATTLTELTADAETRGYHRLAGRAHWMLGLAALQRPDYRTTLRHYHAALRIFEAAKDNANALAVRTLLAELSMYMADSREAWRQRVDALRRADVLSPRRRHTLLMGAANAAVREGIPESALHFAEHAMQAAQRTSSPAFELEARLYLARSLAALRHPASTTHLDAAREILKGLPSGPLRARFASEFALAAAHVAHDTPQRADEFFQEALSVFESQSAHLRTSRVYGERADIRLRRGDFAGAESDLRSAIDRFVVARRTLPKDQLLQLSFFEYGWPVFAKLAGLRARQGQVEEALEIATRGRLLSQPLVERPPTSLPVATYRVPEGTAVVSYVVLNDRLLIWATEPTNSAFAERAIDREALRNMLRSFNSDLRQGVPSWQERGKQLYRLLIAPVEATLGSARTLLVIPDDALSSLPFSALANPKDGRFLIDRFEVSFASPTFSGSTLHPPASVEALIVEAGRGGISINLPILKSTQEEARTVAGFFQDEIVLEGEAATSTKVLAAVSKGPRIIHFAGHAMANVERPLTSRLILGDGQPFFAYDLGEQPLHATHLVFLSACTSLGGPIPGAGLVGFSSALVGAGAGAVIGTLGNVEDDIASAFSRMFYSRYTKEPAFPERAFRAALQELRSDRRWADRTTWTLWAMVKNFPIGE
jgi:CHAT domain-containing protein